MDAAQDTFVARHERYKRNSHAPRKRLTCLQAASTCEMLKMLAMLMMPPLNNWSAMLIIIIIMMNFLEICSKICQRKRPTSEQLQKQAAKLANKQQRKRERNRKRLQQVAQIVIAVGCSQAAQLALPKNNARLLKWLLLILR